MTTVRSAKAKGSSFEYDCQHSLSQIFSTVYLTKERGFQKQFDIKIELPSGAYYAVECKRMKGISWNQLEKIYKKLVEKTPNAKQHYVLFQSNYQPCLAFFVSFRGLMTIRPFEGLFGVSFLKHPSSRKS